MIYLAWVKGPKGPQPQIWHKDKEADVFVTPSDLTVTGKPLLLPSDIRNVEQAVKWAKEAA